MAAQESLGQQFFHTSPADLKPGDEVKPGADVGRNNFPHLRSWRNKSVWMTDNEHSAWGWGHLVGESGDRKTVYQVEPAAAAPQRRRRSGAVGGNEYTAPAARVIRRIDTPVGGAAGSWITKKGPNEERIDEKGNVQGTLIPGRSSEEAAWTPRKAEMMNRNWAAMKATEDANKDRNARRRRERAYKKTEPSLF